MHLLDYFALAFPLGLAGLDPAPALIAAIYLAHHSGRRGRRDIYIFGLALILGTTAWGLILTALFGQKIQEVPWLEMLHWVLHAGWITVLIKTVLGLALVGYGLYAWRKKKQPNDEGKEKTGKGLFLFVLAFIAIVTTDVPFAAYIGMSGDKPFWAQTTALLLWSLIALLPLPPLLLAMALGKDGGFIAVLQKIQKKVAPLVAWGVPVLCLLLGFSLLLDVVVVGLFHLFT